MKTDSRPTKRARSLRRAEYAKSIRTKARVLVEKKPTDKMSALLGCESDKAIGLVVLGGPSGKAWDRIRSETGAACIIGVNGVSTILGETLDYYLSMEAWMRFYGPPPGFNDARPKIRLITQRRWQYVTWTKNAIPVKRDAPLFHDGRDWSIRDYPGALACGPDMEAKEHCKYIPRIGTVAVQALHLAGILGLREIHTIGLDLCWRGSKHHWFDYPPITNENRYWYPSMITKYKGLRTMHFWIESAEYLRWLKNKMSQEGLVWQDHSDGLLQAMGVF